MGIKKRPWNHKDKSVKNHVKPHQMTSFPPVEACLRDAHVANDGRIGGCWYYDRTDPKKLIQNDDPWTQFEENIRPPSVWLFRGIKELCVQYTDVHCTPGHFGKKHLDGLCHVQDLLRWVHLQISASAARPPGFCGMARLVGVAFTVETGSVWTRIQSTKVCIQLQQQWRYSQTLGSFESLQAPRAIYQLMEFGLISEQVLIHVSSLGKSLHQASGVDKSRKILHFDWAPPYHATILGGELQPQKLLAWQEKSNT